VQGAGSRAAVNTAAIAARAAASARFTERMGRLDALMGAAPSGLATYRSTSVQRRARSASAE
jgi:hypothetical protein